MVSIPNELSRRFNTVEGRRKLIEEYANSTTMFSGENEDGECVFLSISESGMILRTEQENGWVRVNYYDQDGYATGEGFDGKWR